MHERIDAECPVGADQTGIAPLEKIETRPPHERAIGEDPKVFVDLTGMCVHRGGDAGLMLA